MKPVDYDHWFKLRYWTLEQAAYLFSGIEPNDENFIAHLGSHRSWQPNRSHYTQLEPSFLEQRFKKNLQILEGYDFPDKKNNDKVPVAKLISTAKDVGIKLNREFLSKWATSQNNSNRKVKPSVIPNEVTTPNDGHFGKETIDAFDPLMISGIAHLFSTISPSFSIGKWKELAGKAKANGLIDARVTVTGGKAESTFNPVRVANWLISKHGSLPEHIERKLRSNLPDRSKDQEEDIFWD